MDNTINGRTPEEIKMGLECYITQNTVGCDDIPCRDCSRYNPNSRFTISACVDAIALIQQFENHIGELTEMVQQLERERDAAVEAAKAKPFTWEEAVQDDCFLEIKDDEYIDAALNIFASSHAEFEEEDHISYLTHDTPEDEIVILYRGDYNRKWRCWPRCPTDEERAAAKWEVNNDGQESS